MFLQHLKNFFGKIRKFTPITYQEDIDMSSILWTPFSKRLGKMEYLIVLIILLVLLIEIRKD